MTKRDRREVLHDALELIGERLRDAGIWHCLAFGTLLGAVRDGELIEWDHDLDLIVRPADLAQIVSSCTDERVSFAPIKIAGAWLALRSGGPGGVSHATLPGVSITVDGTGVGELWAPVLFSDGVLRVYDLDEEVSLWPQTALPAFVFDQLRDVEVRGRSYPAPERAETLLEWIYGEDWRTPTRSVADGGTRVEDRAASGDRASPALQEQIAWCEAQGWDRRIYSMQPRWPRKLAGAGPFGSSDRAAASSGSDWWRSLAEVAEHY
ncbi:MAG TPA: LicD family protein [Gaiellaceae bacterium]|nr:LicD family protein [Gaiellaceae bacterium]